MSIPPLIESRQRTYIASHPVVFWLSIGLLLSGLVSLIAPQLVEQSSTSLALPQWYRTVFTILYTIGAVGTIAGLTRGVARLEAAGQILLGTSFLVHYAALLYVSSRSWLPGLFLLALAIGCLQRGFFLSRNGYPPMLVE